MSIGVDVTKVTGRLVFELSRDDERTTRSIEIPYPIENNASLQSAVDAANALYTNSSEQMNLFVQPSTWRDTNSSEESWATTGVYYEKVTTTTSRVEPD